MENKLKHSDIAKRLGKSRSYICLVLNRNRPISYPLAEILSEIFPEKDIPAWRKSDPEEIEKAFQKMEKAA